MFLYDLLFVIFLVTTKQVDALICSRYPTNRIMPKSPVDDNFIITINGNPQTYVLGQAYNVTIQAYNGHRFISFKLALENDNGDPGINEDLGHFEISNPIETRYSPKCINMVESTNTNPKSRIDVIWVAPQEPGSGCVLIRTTLLQHRDVWFMDDGGLTRRICEESVDEVESAPTGVEGNSCCACDEARFELMFEGKWSRNLHPKDFPAKGWITRFSDIIGASHAEDYRFWEYGQMASEGMKEFAEHGSARTLEREFNYNFKEGKIRTIIKARGPAFPNLNGQSFASIRVDPKHHLLSIASKIDPSPDWIVGLSGLELCMPNCTWLDGKTITLYPWDIGTDAGPSYTSPDQPQIPADVIRRMRSDFPSDPRSPFYDESGAPMRPLAVLKITRQRLYERLCEDEESNNGDVPRECFTHPWTAWSECSTKCGEGRQVRTRVYKQPDVANMFNCEIDTRQDRACMGEECGRIAEHDGSNDDEFLNSAGIEEINGRISRDDCQLTRWSAWSPCSRTCGEGRMMRRRQYVNAMLEKRCKGMQFERLVEYQKCIGRECLEGGRSGHRNQASGEDNERETALKEGEEEGEEEEEEINRREEDEENEEEIVRQSEEDKNEEDEKAGSNENGAEDEKESVSRFGLNKWKQNRNKNRNYDRTLQNSRAAKDEDEDEEGKEEGEKEEEKEEEEGNEEDEEAGEGEEKEEDDHRYNKAGRHRAPFDSRDEEEDNYIGGKQPQNRLNFNSRHTGAGRWNNQIERDDFRTSDRHDRNRWPHSRIKPTADGEDPNGESSIEKPAYCFQLPKRYKCREARGIKNYWFYNHCEDQCMLYTAYDCDKNENKFRSLEACEETCRLGGDIENGKLLQWKQRRRCAKTKEIGIQRGKYFRF